MVEKYRVVAPIMKYEHSGFKVEILLNECVAVRYG